MIPQVEITWVWVAYSSDSHKLGMNGTILNSESFQKKIQSNYKKLLFMACYQRDTVNVPINKRNFTCSIWLYMKY